MLRFIGGFPPPGSDIPIIGNFDVEDVATKTTPVAIPGTGVYQQLTNDGLGAQTSALYAPDAITELWDVVNDEFDFSQLSLGDQVFIRSEVKVEILSVNTDIHMKLAAGIGVTPFDIHWAAGSFKNTGIFTLSRMSFLTMGTTTALTGKAEFQFAADKACNVEVTGWNYIVNMRL